MRLAHEVENTARVIKELEQESINIGTVVADEVRTMAQRSQNSTKEIIAQLKASTSKAVVAMDAGQEKAQATDVSPKAITSAISTIASEEQAAVAEEVNKSIIRITEVAGETSQGAVQTTATSNDLSVLAVELQQMISQFKTV